MRGLRGVFDYFDHMVAGPEAELFQRDFRRHCSGPAIAGADDGKRHETPLRRRQVAAKNSHLSFSNMTC
jgi:hypothetical protein